jgi:hypothetical protein
LADAGLDAKQLETFARDLVSLATSFGEACKKLPPPMSLADELDAWELAADQLAGKLVPSRMAVIGERRGVPFELRPVWEQGASTPVGIECIVRSGVPISSRHHLLWRRKDAPEAPETSLSLGPVFESADALSIDGNVLRALTRNGGPSGAVPILESLIEGARKLAGHEGPYR